jgi:hypothetical protein
VQRYPSRNEERAGKVGGKKKEDTAKKNREKGQKVKGKKYNWRKKAGFRVSGTEKERTRQ